MPIEVVFPYQAPVEIRKLAHVWARECAKHARLTWITPFAGHLVEQVRNIDVRIHAQPRGACAIAAHRRVCGNRRVYCRLLLQRRRLGRWFIVQRP